MGGQRETGPFAGWPHGFSPSTPANWPTVPQSVQEGLDFLAAMIAGGGGGGDVANTVYVATTGSDVSGTGGIFMPFATIQHALDSITTADASQPWVIQVGPGAYPDAFSVKPWIAIIGVAALGLATPPVGRSPVEITAPSDSILLDDAWKTNSIAFAWFGFLGFDSTQTFTLDPATMIPALTFSQCQIGEGWTFNGGDNSNPAAVVFDDCYVPGEVALVGWSVLLRGGTFVEVVEGSLGGAGGQAQQVSVLNSACLEAFVSDGGFAGSINLLMVNSGIDELSVDGTNVLVQIDGIGAPSSGTFFSGGALPTQIEWINYSPQQVADWGGNAPNSMGAALDYLASARKARPRFIDVPINILGPGSNLVAAYAYTPTGTEVAIETSVSMQVTGGAGKVTVGFGSPEGALAQAVATETFADGDIRTIVARGRVTGLTAGTAATLEVFFAIDSAVTVAVDPTASPPNTGMMTTIWDYSPGDEDP